MAKANPERQATFNRLWYEDKWSELREFLLDWLGEKPDDHWILAQIAETYYQQKCFEDAWEYAEKAWRTDPHCPLVIWEYSESLDRLGRHEEAEPLYKTLTRRGVNRIAHGRCGEGVRNARMLVNDSKYVLGLISAGKGDFARAARYIREHISYRRRNWESRFSLREAKKDLALILRGENPRDY